MNTLILLAALGLICLFSEIFGFKRALTPLVIIGLGAAFVANFMDWNMQMQWFNDMMRTDHLAVAFTGALIAITLAWVLMSPDFFRDETNKSDHYALVIFSLIGAQAMVSFGNMIMLFLGVEILSISLYVLAGSRKNDLASNEAALKYFLMGAFATGFLLFGMALLYGASGTFNIELLEASLLNGTASGSVLASSGILLMLIGVAFKASAVPFHFWAPDVYQGSPTAVTAFMSTVVKTAAFAAFFRLFINAFQGLSDFWAPTVWIMCAATILAGNILAVYQQDFKRMLAYSSIAHAGYMLLAILALKSVSAPSSLLYYTVAYSISSLAAFGVLIIIGKKSGLTSIEAFNGLSGKNPLLAAITVVAMLSLAGIPPLAGFFAKYYIFATAIQSGYIVLVVLAVVGSLIGVYYYFRVIVNVFRPADSSEAIEMNGRQSTLLLLASLAALILGIVPQLITGLL